jgi:hypothetical protein
MIRVILRDPLTVAHGSFEPGEPQRADKARPCYKQTSYFIKLYD